MIEESKYNIKLKQIEHLSENKVFEATNSITNEKIFLKIYSKVKSFKTEYEIYKNIFPERIVFNTIYEGHNILGLTFYEMEAPDLQDESLVYKFSKELAQFHAKGNDFKWKNIKVLDIYKSLESKKLKLNNLFSEDLQTIYDFFIENKEKIQTEEKESDFSLLHGDYGSRNIGIIKEEVLLFDFERCYFHSQWNDFMKVFHKEFPDSLTQNIFLKNYAKYNKLQLISKEYFSLIKFIEVLGIISFIKRIPSKNLEDLKNSLINEILEVINKEVQEED